MTYLKHFSRKGESTKLISARIQIHNVEFADDKCFVFGRFINTVLETLVHDLQTDYGIKNEKYWLTVSGSSFTGYKEDYRGSVQKMIRVRCDLLDYLQMNKYKVNTAINLACDRWIEYFKQGNVADYKLIELTDRKKESAKEKEKPKQEEPPKKWTICGNCHYWQPQNRQSDGIAYCNHPKMNRETYRAAFCDHFAGHLESNQTATK